MAVRVIRKFRLLFDVVWGTPNNGDVPTYDSGLDKLVMAAPSGGADDQTAAEVPFTPAGGIAATDVQAAIVELDSEKAAAASAVMDGDAAGGVLSGTYPDPGFAVDMATQAELDDHSARHENGGADEISVAGLSGELADAQPITVRKNTGADVGTRSRLNFIEGTSVTLTVADDPGSDEVDITIASTGDTWVYVVKSVDEEVASSTTVQDDDDFFFTAEAGETYEIEFGILYSNAAGTAPDLKMDFGEDATVRGHFGGFGVSNTDALFAPSAQANQTGTIVLGTVTTQRQAKLTGVYVGGGGTFRLRWAQFSSNVTPSIIHAGSYMKYRKVT